jgi:hypothetical protein
MGKALVIGNGESRAGVNLHQFTDYTTVGCNALHRDFIPDYLVCCDARMVREALENPKTDACKIYVRENWHQYFRKILKNKHVQVVPAIPYSGDKRADSHTHWGSGPYAVLIAAAMDVEEIYLLGFDLYGRQQFVNNIYKGTENYQRSESSAVDPSYWVYQLSKIFEFYPSKTFKIVNHNTWEMPAEWQKDNVEKIDKLLFFS